MNQRTVLMLLISLVLAALAAFSANNWMTNRMAASAGGGLVGAVAAATEIPLGTKIDAASLRMIQLPPDSVPAAAFRDLKTVIGRVASAPIAKGEIVLKGRVNELVGESALASVVQEGKRAFTIQTNNLVGMAGFLVPGNHVDLIGTQRRPDGGTETRTFMRNLKVLAVDPPPSPDQKGTVAVRAISLEVDPSQVERIVGATQAGNLQVALRNPLEVDSPEPEPEPERQPAPKAQPPRPGPGVLGTATPLAPPATPATPAPPANDHRQPETVVVIRAERGTISVQRQCTGRDLKLGTDCGEHRTQVTQPMAAAEALARGGNGPMPAIQLMDAVDSYVGDGLDPAPPGPAQ